jgi:hypothetical protein
VPPSTAIETPESEVVSPNVTVNFLTALVAVALSKTSPVIVPETGTHFVVLVELRSYFTFENVDLVTTLVEASVETIVPDVMVFDWRVEVAILAPDLTTVTDKGAAASVTTVEVCVSAVPPSAGVLFIVVV